jgi:hypothetical protein
MAKRIWKVLPGGRMKRWQASSQGCEWLGVPPRWYRNMYTRRERQRARAATKRGEVEATPYVHPRAAAWYW